MSTGLNKGKDLTESTLLKKMLKKINLTTRNNATKWLI